MPANKQIGNDRFFIASLEELSDGDPFLFHPHKHCGNEFFFVTSGHLIRNCNSNNIRLNKNEFHLSLSRQVSFIHSFSADLQGFYCRFGDLFLEQTFLKENIETDLEFINSFLRQYPIRLNKETSGHLEFLFNALRRFYLKKSVAYTLMQVYLIAIICEVKKLMMESGLDFYPSKAFLITKKYNDLLAEHVTKEHSIQFYAKQLQITPNHLNKSVKSVTGRTAITLLNEVILQEAKTRLKHSNLTIGEIAFQLGFEDLSYFSRFFKKATGFSPIKYRKNI